MTAKLQGFAKPNSEFLYFSLFLLVFLNFPLFSTIFLYYFLFSLFFTILNDFSCLGVLNLILGNAKPNSKWSP